MTTFRGTLYGVNGTFTCIGDEVFCMVTPTTQTTGSMLLITTWTFTPGSGNLSSLNANVRQDHDQEFLYFGIWFSEPDVASEDHDFAVIHGGGITGEDTLALDATHFLALTGQAQFRGDAVGRYVTRNQVGQPDRLGTFTGEARFTADFDLNQINGRIINLQESGSDLSGWWVQLGSTDDSAEPVTESVYHRERRHNGLLRRQRDGHRRLGRRVLRQQITRATWTKPLPAKQASTRTTTRRPIWPDWPVGSMPRMGIPIRTNSDVAIAGAFAATPQ